MEEDVFYIIELGDRVNILRITGIAEIGLLKNIILAFFFIDGSN
jgi:hypothetical protein